VGVVLGLHGGQLREPGSAAPRSKWSPRWCSVPLLCTGGTRSFLTAAAGGLFFPAARLRQGWVPLRRQGADECSTTFPGPGLVGLGPCGSPGKLLSLTPAPPRCARTTSGALEHCVLGRPGEMVDRTHLLIPRSHWSPGTRHRRRTVGPGQTGTSAPLSPPPSGTPATLTRRRQTKGRRPPCRSAYRAASPTTPKTATSTSPPTTAVSGQPVAGAGVAPGPECEGGDTHTGGRAVGVVDETVHDEGDTVDVVDLFAGAGGWRRWAGAGDEHQGHL